MRTPLTCLSLPLLRRALLVLSLLLSAQHALAQAAPSSDDLRALRYYIEQDQTEAIAAELRRLQIMFPEWTPPENLAEIQPAGPTTQIDDIYAKIASGDITGARRILTETQAAFPNWTPSPDLMSQLATAEAQSLFDAAIVRRDPDGALRIALDTPELVRCSRINNTWKLAEAEAQTGDDAAALSAYKQIIGSCSRESDIIATIEKANSVATEAQLRSLVDTASSRFPNSAPAFNALQTRLLDGRGVTLEPDAPRPAPAATVMSTAPTPAPSAAPPPREVTSLSPSTPAPSPAPPSQPSVTSRVQPASPLSGLRSTGDNRLGQVRAAAQAADFRACAARSASPQSLDVAYERAWCVYNLERPLEALALFTAAASGATSSSIQRDARYGMALAMLKRQMTDAASRVAAATDLQDDQRRTVESIILDQRGVRAFQQKDYGQTITYLNGLEALDGTLRRDLALIRGYAYANVGNRDAARAQFQKLHDELATDETRAALKSVVIE